MKARDERVNSRTMTSVEDAFQTSHKNKNNQKHEVRNASMSSYAKGRNVAKKKDKYSRGGICMRTNHLESDCNGKASLNVTTASGLAM